MKERTPALVWGLIATLAMLFTLWLGGLFVFAGMLPTRAADSLTHTDGIVVLTGGSERLETGMALLAAGMADRMLVSGVHPDVQPRELPGINAVAAATVDCCIELGRTAGDTRGNANETATWMADNGLASLRLVTAAYHMPRSLVEFGAAMPEIAILPHPVFPRNVVGEGWWRYRGTSLLIIGEYNKYLLARVRTALSAAEG